MSPIYQAIPAFFKETGYKDPVDGKYTIWQHAWNTPHDPFTWFMRHPDNLELFHNYKAWRRGSEISWLAVYPVAEQIQG